MKTSRFIKFTSIVGAGLFVLATAAYAANFNIPAGDLRSALAAYMAQTGEQLIVSEDDVRGIHTAGVRGNLPADTALIRILEGTGFSVRRDPSGIAGIVRNTRASNAIADDVQVAIGSAPNMPSAALETVTVTSSKVGGDVQNIPISITALSQEQLTATQTTGGPDLIKQVPNMTFTKTNFSGYSIQIRGIGTQAISVTTDPAVAVAFNDEPFIRNHFFEQEFYDVSQVEVLRGPQGTLYGRNATAGVVNLISAKPTDQFEAMASAELGNYQQRRFEGMINVPLVDDRLDLRVAGEWTKRQGYSFNESTDERIDGRDLWSGRMSIGWKPFEKLQTNLVWEHFYEDDDRLRSSKQLCKRAPIPDNIGGIPLSDLNFLGQSAQGTGGIFSENTDGLSQGCLPASLYSPESYQVVNSFALPYVLALSADVSLGNGDPYASEVQSPNLHVIQSQLNPEYKAKNDIVELNADYDINDALTFTSQTGFNNDFLWSTEDYNRFNTRPGIFQYSPPSDDLAGNQRGQISPDGVFCDPQLGCSNKLVAQDLSTEHSWQFNQEFRLASNFSGPLNFSVGGNFLHYETEENYYVFFNSLTLFASVGPVENYRINTPWVPGVSDNHECLERPRKGGFQYPDPTAGSGVSTCIYIDPNPLTNLDDAGHNYFLSQNPYLLDSYASFGEVYYNVLKDVKLTAGLRWTEDRKHFVIIPSELLTGGYGYPIAGSTNQRWDQLTGRFNATWTPKLDFTDQTLFYASYSHGYKAGGANPPGAIILEVASVQPVHPLTFKPEFVDAFELGTKNTLLDGALTLNGDVFYYNYEDYQISEIVDRTSINLNFDAHIKGAELEATYEPLPGLRFNFSGGYENAELAKGDEAVDLMDRTAGHSDWIVIRPDLTAASNCILPVYVAQITGAGSRGVGSPGWCSNAYISGLDPVTGAPYKASPVDGSGNPFIEPTGDIYPGFNPLTAPNDGEGFDKDLSHNEMPNAPPFTVSAGAQYTVPVTPDWAGTLRGDFYWQANSFWRVFNDMDYDRLKGYANLNLTLIFTSQTGWQVMLYDKNVFDTTAITGAFLNSDDSGLTTNVFLTDPKLIGIRVTKNW
jgi:iron complex outermembrane receptor protein